MARIRTIKPDFPHLECIGTVSRDARLCFILLWTIADDSGRLRGNSRMLASVLFPYDEDARDLVDGWLGELEESRCLARYQVEGNIYIQIERWQEYQRIDRPSPSKLPEFTESSRILAGTREPSLDHQRGIVLDTREDLCWKGREGNGKEGNGKEGSLEHVACAPPQAPPTGSPSAPMEKKTRKRSTPVAPKPPRPPKGPPASLAELLGGKDSQTWNRYWKFVNVWDPSKNPHTKDTAALFVQAIATFSDPREFYLKAIAYRDRFLPPNRERDETQYMVSVLVWLQQEGWQNETVTLHDLEVPDAS